MLRHIRFDDLGEQTTLLLIPEKDFDHKKITQHYINPLEKAGIPKKDILVLSLANDENGKYPIAKIVNPHIQTLDKALQRFNIKRALVMEPTYFKKLVNETKVEAHYGYLMESKLDGMPVGICPNYRSLFYDPRNQQKIDLAIDAIVRNYNNKTAKFSINPTDKCRYLQAYDNILLGIKELHQYSVLTCDIETNSLKLDKAGLQTISFAWTREEGIAFPIDKFVYYALPHRISGIRQALKEFFETYKGKLIFHGSPYDVKILVYELWMEHPLDYEGMLKGLDILFRDLDDTKILAYLAQNTTTEVSYGLKQQAQEYVGNYAIEEIENIANLPEEQVLEYNMIDAIATRLIYDRDRPIVQAEQEKVYQEIFRPALKVITQMELCGMPINMGRVLGTKEKLINIRATHRNEIIANDFIRQTEEIMRKNAADKANAKLKILVKSPDDFLDLRFNPGSPQQLAILLYDVLKLPILYKTDKGNPSTGAKVLDALIANLQNETGNEKKIDILNHISEWAKVDKILTTFIPAFEQNTIEKDGWNYLHGGFNLGGTKSGRLSSSKPNLQNLPSTGSKYAKMIKECFQAPPYGPNDNPYGWLIVGADFASLEDRISALQTKDPNKLKVYEDGYDGHCLRAYSYFSDQMPDIDPTNVSSINSIAEKYPHLRQKSKSPTFLLTYMGTAAGLKKTFGFTAKEAREIEENYHKLYKVSDDWVNEQLHIAQEKGYVELAFGLRLRTPILPQVILDSVTLPTVAHQEMKTAGNALGQSYGLLNTRAANEFMRRVWSSPYRYDVLPICQIHDSLYFMVRNNLNCVTWVNKNLIECMEWNELPELQHETVKLEAQMEIFYPTWATSLKIPKNAKRLQIKNLIQENLTPAPLGM